MKFIRLCNALIAEAISIEEMAAPRGRIGVPKAAANRPGTFDKEKFGTQAGKYTGSQMFEILGAFLADYGDSELEYPELQSALNRFLKNRGFGGTAASYWTRALSQAIYDFGHKVERAETDAEAKGIEAVPSQEEPSDSGSGESSVDDEISSTEPSEEPEQVAAPQGNPEADSLDRVSKEIYDSVLDKGQNGFGNNDISELAYGNLFADPKDPTGATGDPSDNIEKIKSVLVKLKGLGLIQKSDRGWVVPTEDEEGDTPTFDRHDDGPDYGAQDTISRYANQYGDGKEMDFQSIDFDRIFKKSFKNLVD